MKKIVLFVILTVLLILPLYAQSGKIAGRVTIEKSGQPLANAAVILVGMEQGTYTKDNGTFTLTDVPVGMAEVQFRYMGYGTKTVEVDVEENETAIVNIQLVVKLIGIEGINIVSDRATERRTPVAFTDMDKEEMQSQLGSRDIPLALVTTPSVYATDQGGGAGDARVNVRGFDQRNVAIMINGVPVNDMENGWVYWSNWDGVGDATSSIQMQRGLSAVNLTTPSIGGTMNIITDPTAMKAGVNLKQEFGTAGFLKTTLSAGSGLIDNKIAFSASGVKKTGVGLIDKTWTDAWAYYLSTGWNINANNKLELYVVGAPQRHGQNLYKQNIAVYDPEYAADLDDYDPLSLDNWIEGGREFNENWGSVSADYAGKQWWNGSEHDRYDEEFINERENFYHKPQINLNWYTKLNEDFNLYSIVYYSGGKGGGTGTLMDIEWDYSTPTRTADWDATIAVNDTSSIGSLGILRNSVNSQWTIGAISKAYYTINENFKTSVGVDWRTAEIEHFREVRDLLGGEYIIPDPWYSSDFWTGDENQRKLGDKIAYYNTNTVDWMGGYLQGEYSQNAVTAYMMGGLSSIKYSFVDHFAADDEGDEVTAETEWIKGFQIKGGSSLIINENIDIFGNAGYVSKVPIFDDVIDDGNGTVAADPENEKFISFEAGMNFMGLDDQFAVKTNVYFTNWANQTLSRGVTNEDGSEGLIFISGMDSRHMGIEIETNYRPIYFVQFDLAASVANWVYTNNVSATYDDYGSTGNIDTLNIYVEDLKVGNAPQTQLSFGTSFFPLEGLKAQFVVQHYRDQYSDFNPFDRTDEEDTTQSWKIPDYTKLNFHLSYLLPVNFKGINVSVFAHLFNVLDSAFIQDATDNSSYNGFDGDHDADDAEVFFGMQRTFNAGLTITF